MSATTKPFWFPFNVTDWLSSKSVRMMSHAERGVYIGLLATAWGEDVPGTLPTDEDEVRRMAEMSPEQWATSGPRLLKKFPLSECGTYRYNPRLLAEGKEQRRKSELAAEAGRRSAEAKKQRNGNGKSTDVAPQPTDVEKMATESQLVITTVTLPTDVGRNAGEPAGGQILEVVKPSLREVPADEAPVFARTGFREFLKSIGYGHVDVPTYWLQIQREADKLPPRLNATPSGSKAKSWEGFIQNWLKNDRLNNCLLLPESQQPAGAAGRHAVTPTPSAAPYDINKVAAEQRSQVII
ncbi:MAG: DUF1376 domain-containing protein [Janthinobacterium lividum]